MAVTLLGAIRRGYPKGTGVCPVLSPVVASGALLVALVCATLLTTRHRRDRSSAKARRVRNVGLWSLVVGVAALLVFWFAGS